MKKLISLVLSVVAFFMVLFTFTGCSSSNKGFPDSKKIRDRGFNYKFTIPKTWKLTGKDDLPVWIASEYVQDFSEFAGSPQPEDKSLLFGGASPTLERDEYYINPDSAQNLITIKVFKIPEVQGKLTIRDVIAMNNIDFLAGWIAKFEEINEREFYIATASSYDECYIIALTVVDDYFYVFVAGSVGNSVSFASKVIKSIDIKKPGLFTGISDGFTLPFVFVKSIILYNGETSLFSKNFLFLYPMGFIAGIILFLVIVVTVIKSIKE